MKKKKEKGKKKKRKETDQCIDRSTSTVQRNLLIETQYSRNFRFIANIRFVRKLAGAFLSMTFNQLLRQPTKNKFIVLTKRREIARLK